MLRMSNEGLSKVIGAENGQVEVLADLERSEQSQVPESRTPPEPSKLD